MSDLKDKITVMERAFGGEEVECILLHSSDTWEVNKNPTWDWFNFDYRIKEIVSEPVYYYRWKKIRGNSVMMSSYTSEPIYGSWTRIESSKTTFEEIK